MRIFWIGFGVTFLLALTFPLAVRLCLPASTQPNRWIQNNPPFSVFMLSAFPIAVGVFCVTFNRLQEVDVFDVKTFGTPWALYLSVAVLLVMFVFASIIVINDFTSRPIGPYILRGAAAVEAFRLEKELRDAAKTSPPEPPPADKRQAYQSLIQLNSLGNTFKQGNFVALSYLVIAWCATLFCVFYFWYVAVLVLSDVSIPQRTVTKLFMIFILLVTWFPMRVHTDWYQNHFHCDTWLRQSHAFWLGIVMAIASLFFVLFIARPEALVIFFTSVNAAVLAFVGLTGRFKPEWLRAVADLLQSTPFVYFIAAYTIFLFVTAVIGIRILND